MQNSEQIYAFIRTECKRLNLDPNTYRIGNDVSAELGELAFDFQNDVWRVYVVERGKEYDVATFQKDMDAIRYFFMQLTTGPSNYVMPKIEFKSLPR